MPSLFSSVASRSRSISTCVKGGVKHWFWVELPLITFISTFLFFSKMSPQDGSRQKLRNYGMSTFCWSYAEKTVASFFRTRCTCNSVKAIEPYTVWWAIGIYHTVVCPFACAVRPSVCDAVHCVLRIGIIGGWKLYHRVPRTALPIHFFRHLLLLLFFFFFFFFFFLFYFLFFFWLGWPSSKKPKVPSFQIGSRWNVAGLFLQ